MSLDAQVELPDFDDDVVRVAALARKATRKAARAANRAGYFFEYEKGACRVKTPKQVVRIDAKTTSIDIKKRYTFAP